RSLELRCRMSGGVDLLELFDRHLRVELRRLDRGVSEHLLHVTDVGSSLEHQGGHRVTEEMTRTTLADLRGVDEARNPSREQIRRERLSGVREEHEAVIGFDDELRPDF